MKAIKDYMTPSPHTIGMEQTVAKAEEMMNKYGIRHLPVLEGGKLIGVVTNRDVLLMKSFPGIDIHKTPLSEASTMGPYAVPPTANLKSVCLEMVENKYSCAVIVENDKTLGIFSWIDALKALASVV